MSAWSSTRSPAPGAALRKTRILLVWFIAITAVLVACSGQDARQIAIRFTVSGVDPANVRDLRFYLHDVALLGADGGVHPVELIAVAKWQSERVALIDLAGANAADRNEFLRGMLRDKPKDVIGIRLTVGVPFELNHANPLTAVAPLNRGDMFWAWQTGYKFLRADLSEREREWSFHLGSTGCSSASSLRPPTSPCAQPNLMRLELRGIDPLTQPVQVNLEALLAAMRSSGFQACTGDYSGNTGCSAAYAVSGLTLATGRCENDLCISQRLFGAR